MYAIQQIISNHSFSFINSCKLICCITVTSLVAIGAKFALHDISEKSMLYYVLLIETKVILFKCILCILKYAISMAEFYKDTNESLVIISLELAIASRIWLYYVVTAVKFFRIGILPFCIVEKSFICLTHMHSCFKQLCALFKFRKSVLRYFNK